MFCKLPNQTEIEFKQDKNILNQYKFENRQASNISYTLVGNKIVDHSDVVGAAPTGAASTTSSFST